MLFLTVLITQVGVGSMINEVINIETTYQFIYFYFYYKLYFWQFFVPEVWDRCLSSQMKFQNEHLLFL